MGGVVERSARDAPRLDGGVFGGQQIAAVPEMDMVLAVTADPLFQDHGGAGWSREKANLNLVADFIAGLPLQRDPRPAA